jgi:hypothetical protein
LGRVTPKQYRPDQMKNQRTKHKSQSSQRNAKVASLCPADGMCLCVCSCFGCARIAVSLRAPAFRYARRGRCAWLYLRIGELLSSSQGRPPNPSFPPRSAWTLRLAWSLRRACELDCRSRGRPPNSLYPLRTAWPLNFGGHANACVRVGLPQSR